MQYIVARLSRATGALSFAPMLVMAMLLLPGPAQADTGDRTVSLSMSVTKPGTDYPIAKARPGGWVEVRIQADSHPSSIVGLGATITFDPTRMTPESLPPGTWESGYGKLWWTWDGAKPPAATFRFRVSHTAGTAEFGFVQADASAWDTVGPLSVSATGTAVTVAQNALRATPIPSPPATPWFPLRPLPAPLPPGRP